LLFHLPSTCLEAQVSQCTTRSCYIVLDPFCNGLRREIRSAIQLSCVLFGYVVSVERAD
jgi:hypothetical protein